MKREFLFNDAIQSCIDGKERKDSIFPFLWVHGESWERLQDEIDAIYNCGLREFCVESRTHEQFCEEQWWCDFGFILKYAAQKDMRVWLLDDKHFPTGYANGVIEKKYPHLKRKRVRIAFVDVAGPLKDACIMLPPMDSNEYIVSASAFARTGNAEDVDGKSGVLITEKIQDGLVYWDIPKGVWRIFYIIWTERGPSYYKNYIDMCDADSCKIMLSEIYEPHYIHFKKYFGNTFRGFFSDEPCFGNTQGVFTGSLGDPALILSWRLDMINLLANFLNISEKEAELRLPALWFKITNKTASVRFAYMDIVTKLYRDNFSMMLGNWCKEKNVMYIGHIMESCNVRFGLGSGHFFRSMEGQDMAGMDIVLNCIHPGIIGMAHSCSTTLGIVREPAFIHYTMGRMAASSAHLDPRKQGRVMCEIYGAFGWSEGLPMMKYLTDFMMAIGANHFVPHAFSGKIEDVDCPPHFYNGGMNPQYSGFRKLMDYTARMCSILRAGKSCANLAVYFNEESACCGDEYIDLNVIAETLEKAYIDYDFVPLDYLMEAHSVDGDLTIRECIYKALLVPYGSILPECVCQKLKTLSEQGVRVIYAGGKPSETEYGRRVELQGDVVSLRDLTVMMNQLSLNVVNLRGDATNLRVLHKKDGIDDLYFFFNPEAAATVDAQVYFADCPAVTAYDAWHNCVNGIHGNDGWYPLVLQPGCSIIWCIRRTGTVLPQADILKWESFTPASIKVALDKGGNIIFEEEVSPGNALKNYAKMFSGFGGIIRYEFTCERDIKFIRLGTVGEVSRLWIDGVDMGIEIDDPHIFAVKGIKTGSTHKVTVEVAVNQGYAYRDSRFSAHLPMKPMGMMGPIEIVKA